MRMPCPVPSGDTMSISIIISSRRRVSICVAISRCLWDTSNRYLPQLRRLGFFTGGGGMSRLDEGFGRVVDGVLVSSL